MKCLTVFKNDEEIITMPIEDITLESFLTSNVAPISPKETISYFKTYLFRIEDYLYSAADVVKLKIEKLRNKEKVIFFSNLSEMVEFYDELDFQQRELCKYHQEIGKIEAIINLILTTEEKGEKEAKWSIDWE